MKTSVKPFTTHKVVPNTKTKQLYSVEYFHIYSDENIEDRHTKSIEYLKTMHESWDFDYQKAILIDNYNPTTVVIEASEILAFLDSISMRPDYWAYEKDMIENAKILLDAINNKKIEKEYRTYIKNHNKYPCSLLTAAWYLTRLGYLNSEGIIRTTIFGDNFIPAERLLNILPQDYKTTEARAFKIIMKSEYKDAFNKIQDFFYPIDSGRAMDLF
jgi:hypothetical protein